MADDVHVDEKVLAKFAQKLAGNEKKTRDRAVKKLRRWLLVRSSKGGFSEEELLKIWKGLHFCMWMADKPLVQEELAETLSRLLNCFKTIEESLKFFDVFLKTEAREWFGIDRLRLDKFMMLVRRMYHHMLKRLAQNDWPQIHLSTLTRILSTGVLHPTNDNIPDGLKFHIVDLYFDELEKLNSDKVIDVDRIHIMLELFCEMLSNLRNQILMKHVVKNVFKRLVTNQTKAVFEMEEVEDEDDLESQCLTKVLEVDYAALSDRLFELASSEQCVMRNRSTIYSLVKTFKNLSCGALGDDGYISESDDSLDEMDYEQATERLKHFENNLMSHNKKKRKKARKDPSVTAKKRRLDSPRSRCFISESLKKKQEVMRTKRLGTKNLVPDVAKEVTTAIKKKTKKSKGMGEPLKKKKLKSANNFAPVRNGMVASTSAFNKTKLSKSAKAKRKRMKLGSVQNATESLKSVSNKGQGVYGSQTDSMLQKDMKNSVEVFDLSVSPSESRTLKDTVQETSGASSDENVVRNKKLGKLKIRNSKGNVENNDHSVLGTSSCDNGTDHIPKPIAPIGTPQSPSDSSISKKHKKKKMSSPEQETGFLQKNSDLPFSEEETPDVKRQKKKKNKSPMTSTPKLMQDQQEGDVEIWVPNKKYQGEHKAAFQKKMEESLLSKDILEQNGEEIPRKKFATFDKMKKSPPAFVRKAIEKIAPHSEPRKQRKKKDEVLKAPGSAPGSGKSKKRVSFIMERNMEQDFKTFRKSLNLSPAVPFDPAMKPDQGILKSPATPDLLKPKTRKKKSPQKTNKRPKAADFF